MRMVTVLDKFLSAKCKKLDYLGDIKVKSTYTMHADVDA